MRVQNTSRAELCHLIVIFPLIISALDNKVVGTFKTFLRSLRVGFITAMQCSFRSLPYTFKIFVKNA